MKKILFLGLAIVLGFTLAGCSETNDYSDLLTSEIKSEQSLATLSYLSTGFLDFSNEPVLAAEMAFLSDTDGEAEPTTIEGELDEVNIYIDRLKALIDNGVKDFGSVVEEESENELYAYKLTFTVNEEVYIIHYNLDETTGEMTGIIVIGSVEYDFEVLDNMKEYEHNQEEKNENPGKSDSNGKSNEDDDEEFEEELEIEEDDDDSDEVETKMVLIATNGTDTIKITYKTEVEDDESTIKFYVDKTIDGVEERVTLKISEEEGETKVKISDGEDEYTFKREVEEEGTVYILQYEVDGVKGMVRITEVVEDDGTITYDYFIQEAGREKHTEKQEPNSHGFDDEEENEEEDELET